jgi:thioredoxin 1
MLDTILDDLGGKMEGLRIFKVDADASEEIRDAYNIRSVPVLILFKNGEPVWRMNGFMMADDLAKVIGEHL